MSNRVREQRVRLGLGQAELAERAGVPRQTVGAIESGRHSPSVDAALRLAGALGVSVETLFSVGEVPVADVPVLSPGAVGSPVVVGRVGDRRVYAPVRHLLSADAWGIADGYVGPEGLEIEDDIDDSGLVVAGCDPLLGLVTSVLERRRAPRVVPVHLSTGDAIRALTDGTVHGVVVHGPRGAMPTPPVSVRRWQFASWRVGVASPSRRGVVSIEELAQRRCRTAQREEGAGTQRALVRALAEVGATELPGPRVSGHIEAARHVVAGLPAGITMEAAAAAFALGFLPLETHHSELWIDRRFVDHRGAEALVSALSEQTLVRRAARLPGYDVARIGTELPATTGHATTGRATRGRATTGRAS